jgi:DNA-binding IclR family transcriptional regulator
MAASVRTALTAGQASLEDETGGTAAVGVVSRVVGLLRSFAEAGGSVSIKQLSGELGLAPSTLHRLLEQLVEAGMIERAPHRRYRVGAEFSRIGALAARKAGVLRLARPVLEDVARETAETCMLGMLLPQTLTMMFVDKVPAAQPLPYEVRVHRTRSLLWGATGLCILAWLGQQELEDVLRRGELSPVNGRSPPQGVVLAERLARIRARGFAITRGEQTRGAVGMAAPVFGAYGRIVADLCITVPQARFHAGDEAAFARLLTERAAQLSCVTGSLPASLPASRR